MHIYLNNLPELFDEKYFDSHDIAVRNKDCDIKGAIRLTINNKEIMEYVFKKLREYN
jgi:hypothetical protein